jgi:uncharacterized protein YndB with AHSA1/START domain
MEGRATVQVRRRFDASPKRVFDAWVAPAEIQKWIEAQTFGDEAVRVDVRARVGQPFRLIVRRGGEEISHSGEYVELRPSRRLVFTWVVPSVSKETTLVSIDLTPVPSVWGGTDLVLKHERVLPADTAQTEATWLRVLEAIAMIIHPNGSPARQ